MGRAVINYGVVLDQLEERRPYCEMEAASADHEPRVISHICMIHTVKEPFCSVIDFTAHNHVVCPDGASTQAFEMGI